MAQVSLGELADFVGGAFDGDRAVIVTGVAPLADAASGDLTFLSNPRYAGQLKTTAASAVLVATAQEGQSGRWIRVANPYFQFARVMQRWFATVAGPVGVSPLASIAEGVALGESVAIGPFVTIARGVSIGARTRVFQGTSIEANSVIGADCLIYPNVSIYAGTILGDRCIIHSGVVLGSDGFGFATDGGMHHKIPQIGIVRIEEDVEIGANSTIDRAALGETVIGAGSKIDNLVQVAHNVKMGRHCLLVSQAGVAGSSELGDYVVVAGQSGIAGHLKIGAGVQVGAKSAVMKSWSGKGVIGGIPARPIAETLKAEAAVRRLPALLARVAELERRLEVTNESVTPEK